MKDSALVRDYTNVMMDNFVSYFPAGTRIPSSNPQSVFTVAEVFKFKITILSQ